MSGKIAILQALTSLHAGAAGAVGAIDLPIQREQHTQWPMMQSGGIKGVFRDAAREFIRAENAADPNADPDTHSDLTAIFGPPTENADDYAGALVVTDARILLFPVRSLKGVYALITCPGVLKRYADDQKLAGLTPIGHLSSEPFETETWCVEPEGKELLFFDVGDDAKKKQQAVFADMAFDYCANESTELTDALRHLESITGEDANRIVVVSDDVFGWFVRFHTEVIARNRLESETKTVAKGALWNEEYLPPQTFMYSVLLAGRVYSGQEQEQKLDVLTTLGEWIGDKTLQFGGNGSTGKGLCTVHLTDEDGAQTGGADNA